MIEGFRYPMVLVLLLVPSLLLYWTWRLSGREIALPMDHGTQANGSVWRIAINCFESLPPFLLAIVIVLLAGPIQLSAPRSKRALTNIEFCVDNSFSMTTPFGETTRYDASMLAIQSFTDYRKGDAFGLTFFSEASLQWVPLTTDTSAFKYALPFMRPEAMVLGGGTEIGRGLLACRKTLLEREEGDRMIILVSDGVSPDLYGRDDEIGRQLKNDGIVVIDVHVAGGEVPDEVVKICYLTGGEVFQPGDTDSLAAVFKRIDAMQKTKLERMTSEPRDAFTLLSTLGLSLMSLMAIASFGMRYTPW